MTIETANYERLSAQLKELETDLDDAKRQIALFQNSDDIQLCNAAVAIETQILWQIGGSYQHLDPLVDDAKLDADVAARVKTILNLDVAQLKQLGKVLRACKSKCNEKVHGQLTACGASLLIGEFESRLPHKMQHREQVIAAVKLQAATILNSD